MTQRKALVQWEKRRANCGVTPEAFWLTAKFLLERDGPKAPTAIQYPSSLKFHPKDKANAIADCLENHFTPLDCTTKTMNGRWKLDSKLCWKP
jgi:hypothetical protein